jgi:hypothetical protein
MQHFGVEIKVIVLSALLLNVSSGHSHTGNPTQLAQMDHSHMSQGNTKAPPTNTETHNKKDEKTKPAPTALKPADGAKIKILAPTKDQIFKGDKVPVQFQLTKGKRGHHAHAYVDGELMGMFESEKGTLNGIKPGTHVLELRVVAEDHKTELDATDKITFSVK